jgi:hypothetical protein
METAPSLSSFLERCARYCAAKGISEARLSTLLFNHGAWIGKLRSGSDMGVSRLMRAERDLDKLFIDLGSAAEAERARLTPGSKAGVA